MALAGLEYIVDANIHPGGQFTILSGPKLGLCSLRDWPGGCYVWGANPFWPADYAGLWNGALIGPEHTARTDPGGCGGSAGALFFPEKVRRHVAAVCAGAAGRFFLRYGADRYVCHGDHTYTEISREVGLLGIDD